MEEGKKHTNILWEDFLSYLTRSFTNEEAHQFERKVDKSLFDFEAVEGMEPFAGASINYDLENMKEKIHNRNTLKQGPKRGRTLDYRKVAVVAILVIVLGGVSTFWLLNKGGGNDFIAQNEGVASEEEEMVPITLQETDSSVSPVALNTKSQKLEEKTSKQGNVSIVDDELELEQDFALEIADFDEEDSKNDKVLTLSKPTKKVESNQKKSKQILTTDSVELQNLIQQNLLNTKVQIEPTSGKRSFIRGLKKALKKEDESLEGEVTVNILFAASKVIEVSSPQRLNTNLKRIIYNYIKNDAHWQTDESEEVPDGLYTYVIEL